MARPPVKQLEAFVAVADHESFRRAADRLGTTQPNVSARIAALEDLWGGRLFDRDAGSVRLTALGARLLDPARAALAAMDRVTAAVGRPDLWTGTLRLGVTEVVVHGWLGRFLARLKREFPAVEVELSVALSAELTEALWARRIDLALQSGPFGRATSGDRPLGSYPLTWLAAPSLGFGPGPHRVEDLARHPILTHARGTEPFRQIAARLPGARLVPSSNVTACLQMAAEGLGVACLPEVMVRGAGLERLEADWTPAPLSFHARYHAEGAGHVVAEAARIAAEVAKDHQE